MGIKSDLELYCRKEAVDALQEKFQAVIKARNEDILQAMTAMVNHLNGAMMHEPSLRVMNDLDTVGDLIIEIYREKSKS